MATGIVALDMFGKILYSNHQFAHQLRLPPGGWPSQQDLSKHFKAVSELEYGLQAL